ncbi:MAG: MFS transporter [Desulfobacterales bacterium]
METCSERSLVRRMPFYYGWVIVVAGTIGLIMTQPGQSPVLSIFTDAFIRDLNISRSLTSTLFTVGTVVGGMSLSFWGGRIDRHGPRRMVGVISALVGISCLYMAVVQNAWMLGVGYVLLRMLGAGALMLASNNVINQWWEARRGTMMGLSGVAFSLVGMGLFTNFVHALLQRFGWRSTYAILGGMEILVMLPLGLLLFRDRPEDHGLQTDGKLHAPGGLGGKEQATDPWTRAEAVRTPAFWTAAISLAATAMLGTGLYFHMVSIFESQGLSSDVAAAVYVPISVTSAVAQLGSGYLADRVPIRILLAAGLVGMSVALGLAQVLFAAPLAIVYGVVLGVSNGITGTVSSIVWADYFGRRHLGSISGLAAMFSRVASALGPLPLAVAFDMGSGYATALRIEVVIPLLQVEHSQQQGRQTA